MKKIITTLFAIMLAVSLAFAGGRTIKSVQEYVHTEVEYPTKALSGNIEGIVMLKYTVKNGIIVNIETNSNSDVLSNGVVEQLLNKKIKCEDCSGYIKLVFKLK